MKEALRGKNILLVEDESNIRKVMKLYLQRAGFEVIEASNGKHARVQFLKYDPCFVILDMILPGEDGSSICHWIRHDLKSNAPIIIVSARCEVEDRIKGLQTGADDFLGKPFSPSELVARVETVLRRTANRCSKISYQGLTIKPIKGEVRFEDRVIDLTLFEYKMLLYFMMNPNQVITREQMINNLYEDGQKAINDRTIDVHIKHLRSKINECTEYPFIETIRGMGYRFNP
ncbi:response regulator transcription factor [Bacillus sp. JJ722]|uniref:response regulator transcription factor n=1 Tax=Bacillus sp. JJ722 TaxID=3122973 RepID=UPI002FFF9DB5